MTAIPFFSPVVVHIVCYSPSWELSLNGKSTLSSLDASALSALGICSGDLVYIVDTQQTAPPMAFQPTSTQSATCTSANTVAKTGTQPSASASSACRNASLAAGLMETDVVSEQSSKSSFPVETQDPNLILVLTALSNYSFHLPPSVSAPELLAQGTLQAMDVYPTFAPNTTVHIKLVAMGGQLCVHARWQQGIAQGRVVSVVVPCLTLPARPLAVEQCRRKLQVHPVYGWPKLGVTSPQPIVNRTTLFTPYLWSCEPISTYLAWTV
jgi:hypothetical protein